jgi:transcriptional regulator with XRE-family HTH domain
MPTVLENIKAIRKEQNLGQKQIAVKLGISSCSYSRFEQGRVEIKLHRLEKLAEILNVGVADFYNRKPVKKAIKINRDHPVKLKAEEEDIFSSEISIDDVSLDAGLEGAERVTAIISAITRVSVERIKMPDGLYGARGKNNVIARHLCMYFISSRRVANFSLKATGVFLGNRDHSSVIHGISCVLKRKQKDLKYLKLFKKISDTIKKEFPYNVEEEEIKETAEA